jgi:drug/metabolite transporter (DMT)-like permease
MQATRRGALLSAAVGISAVGASVAVSSRLTAYPVLTAQAARYGLAAAILLALARPGAGRGEPRGTPRDWLCILLVAGAGMALFNVAVVRAVSSGEPAVVATIVGCAPVVLSLAVPALERRRPVPPVVAGACVVAGGAALVEGFGRVDAAALGWSALALACEVIFTLCAAPVLRTISPLALSLRACALAAVLLALASVALEGGGALRAPDRGELLAIAYLAVVSTVVAFLLWYGAVHRLGAAALADVRGDPGGGRGPGPRPRAVAGAPRGRAARPARASARAVRAALAARARPTRAPPSPWPARPAAGGGEADLGRGSGAPAGPAQTFGRSLRWATARPPPPAASVRYGGTV